MQPRSPFLAISPFRTLVLFGLLAVVGLGLLPRLAVDLQPRKRQPILQVIYALPRASPELVENQVTSVLENVLSQLAEVEKLASVSRYNGGAITLTVDKNANLDFKKMEVAALIRQVYPSLPPTASYPLVFESNSDTRPLPMLVYSVAAPFAAVAIQAEIERSLKAPLAIHRAVQEVQVSGADPQEIVVEYDLPRLLAHQLTRAQLLEALALHAREHELGVFVNEVGQRLFIKTPSQLHDLQAFEELPLAPRVRLRDVARVYLSEQEPTQHFRINGLNSVRLNVYARENANKLVLAKELQAQVAALAKGLPAGYQVLLEYDTTEKIAEELDKIYYRTGLSILILLVSIFLTNFNLRYLLALMSGVVVNLLITAILVYALGVQIHLYSLAGLTISFGMIVDNAIVMMDHLRRRGDRSVFGALLGATLTTLVGMLLVFLLPDEQKENLVDFGLIITLNLLVSLAVALWYTPAAYALLLARARERPPMRYARRRRQARWVGRYYRAVAWLARHRRWVNASLVLAFGLPVFWLPTKVEGWEWYNRTLGHEWYQEEVRPYVNQALGGSLRLFANNVYEGSGFRSLDRNRLYVNAEMPFGTTLAQMDEVMQKVEKYLQNVAGLDKFVTEVYSGTDAQITITFAPAYEKSSLPYQLKGRLIAQSIDWGGVGWSIYGVGDGFSNQSHEGLANFRVEMRGYHYLELERQAEVLAQKLLAHPRIQKVNTNEVMNYWDKKSQQYVFLFNNAALQHRGLSTAQATEALTLRSKTYAPSLYAFYGREQLPIRLTDRQAETFSAYQASHEALPLDARRRLVLGQVGSLRFENTASALYKENRQYLRIVSFDYFGSSNFGSKYLDEKLAEMKAEMPAGYSVAGSNFNFWNNEKARRQYELLAILLGGIFVICCILLESFRQPFLILLSAPLSFVGVFLAFAWGGFYFDQGGYAAFLLLSGLVVNASIFVICDYNQLRRGRPNRNVVKAVLGKAGPILLSVFSTVLGLVPFLSEGDKEVFWFSFAVGTISGLVASLVGLFVVLPVWMWGRERPKVVG
jgi:multidrug efflux pump subunit AcrB